MKHTAHMQLHLVPAVVVAQIESRHGSHGCFLCVDVHVMVARFFFAARPDHGHPVV